MASVQLALVSSIRQRTLEERLSQPNLDYISKQTLFEVRYSLLYFYCSHISYHIIVLQLQGLLLGFLW
jgi:hypothetical protein